jgi:hypothetical protein
VLCMVGLFVYCDGGELEALEGWGHLVRRVMYREELGWRYDVHTMSSTLEPDHAIPTRIRDSTPCKQSYNTHLTQH